jgi:hypothetical protein
VLRNWRAASLRSVLSEMTRLFSRSVTNAAALARYALLILKYVALWRGHSVDHARVLPDLDLSI